MKAGRQTTLRKRIRSAGIGVHSGLPVTLTLSPAEADTGIVFVRCGLDGEPEREIRADCARRDRDRIRHRAGRRRGPVRLHRRACAGCAVRPRRRQRDRRDRRSGSSDHGRQRRAVRRRDRSGRHRRCCSAPRRYFKVLKPVRVAKGDAFGELRPYERGFRVEVEIEFDHPLIGRQTLASMSNRRPSAARSRAPAPSASCATSRKLWSAGYALGASLENTLVVAETACSIRKVCASPTSSCATRRSMRSATSRSPARPFSAPIGRCGAATSSIMPCCAR